MEKEKKYLDLDLNIKEIELTQKRILEHHIEFKNMFKEFTEALKHEERERRDSDEEIRYECREGVSQIYKNVAAYGIAIIVTMVTGVVGYIAYKI